MEQYFSGGETEDKQQRIMEEAKARYGADAYFAYLRIADRQLLTLTLEEAMQICGPFIANEDSAVLWEKLDKWHAAATKLEGVSGVLFATSRNLGQQALNEYKNRVGDVGGASS